MDGVLSEGKEAASELTGRFIPPELRVEMPAQSLRSCWPTVPERRPRALSRSRLTMRRLVVLGGGAVIAAWAINQMRLVLDVRGLTVVEVVVLGLFAINTIWIAVPAMAALVGGVRLLLRRRRRREDARESLRTRTVLLVPLYNEDVARVGAWLEATAREIIARGHGPAFDIFLLSDSNDGDIALAEAEVVWTLRRRLGDAMAVYYRRRLRNTAHKAGNVREFCERWGRAYDHMVVLDADSLMEARTLIELARRMERDPEAGLIQTVPFLVGGTSLLARTQQFASRVYGPPLAAGMAWWTGTEGNFWGHNAIIRTRAFIESAGLPELPGRPPLGGPILSHDFVEAALLRRAGWSVRVADDLGGSYEACPETLIDLSLRERRWCQGNLQHGRVLLAKGLHWVSRIHLLTGILAFVSSPLWLLFLLATLALGVQNEFAKPEYFTRGYTLFPVWPQIDAARALRLFYLTLVILLAPKAIGLLCFMTGSRRVRGSGGLLRLLLSVVVELVLSALLAPIVMLIHCGFIASILAGRDGGWRPQRRGDQRVPWTQIAFRHRWHVVMGVLLAVAAHSVSWQMLAWLSPAVLGMVAAVPLSLVSGEARVGAWAKQRGLLRTPEERWPPAIWEASQAAYPVYRDAVREAPDLAAVVSDARRLRRQLAINDRPLPRASEPILAVEASAVLKVIAASSLEEATERLTSQERAFVAADAELLLRLSRMPRGHRHAVAEVIRAAMERSNAPAGYGRQIEELVLQSLEHELAGERIYASALDCVVDPELKRVWQRYLDETRMHAAALRDVCRAMALDPGRETPGRRLVRRLGTALDDAIKLAMTSAAPEAAELTAAECVVLAETKDRLDWELLARCAQTLDGRAGTILRAAATTIEHQEDTHLEHSRDCWRELWMSALGMRAGLPPAEGRLGTSMVMAVAHTTPEAGEKR